MKKLYTIIGLLALTVSVSAQNQNRTATKSSHLIGTIPMSAVATPTTLLLVPASIAGTTCSLSIYTAGSDGYVAGTNSYDDKGKAQKYSLATYSLSTPATVDAAGAIFAVVDDGGNGSSVSAKIYSDVAGEPGVLLGTSLPVMLSSAVAGTVTPFFFASPVALTGNIFYVSIDISGLNSAAGDTVALAQTDDGCVDNTSMGSWELFSDDTWLDMESDWGFISTDLAIFAQVTADFATGIKKQSNNLVSVSPNPSHGIFNVSLKSAGSEVNVTVTNAIGQTVVAKNYNSSESISFDLSNQNNGVYFVTITSGTDRMVKKVVLNK
jgi:hypothetical protein